MGARVGRMFWRFNVENRAHREISKSKPKPAPRYEAQQPGPVASEEIHRKDDPLLVRLQQVYVESKDPVTKAAAIPERQQTERRPLKHNFPDVLGVSEVNDVPVGKLSLLEVLHVLKDHKLSPQTWTAEKIAQEYSLQLNEAEALKDFFMIFEIKVLPPKTSEKKQIKDT
ncbi:NADH dehydrogenase [ubiquinone] 1 alpha subcomplex assembly factor 4 [Salminus brasiliensis]|uniref:NADH dehydrogenase [ubiquinone] 1 alpha subcomplex assembly factor 4 n=1 Tax=Salminus brasiliensis TaxID=930266 RepID=UPI003B838279